MVGTAEGSVWSSLSKTLKKECEEPKRAGVRRKKKEGDV
jgi:hypothetical protein